MGVFESKPEPPAYVGEVLKRNEEEGTGKPAEGEYNLILVRGVPNNPSFDVKRFEAIIDDFVTKDGDVFVATYVKAGTTWTQQIIHQLLRQGEEGGFYGDSVPWLESMASDLLMPRESPAWSLELINDNPGPRYFKTHATVAHLPRGRKPANYKVIYVARNPKDSVVSLYHHAKSKPEFGFKGDFARFCEIFIASHAENGSWFDHVLEWHAECKAKPETHLFLKYEDMYQNPANAVRTIANFLGIALTDEVLANVVKNSSIGEMKQKASIGLNHLRQGGYGNWRTMFTVSMSEFFDDVYRFKMKDTDLTFNFGPGSDGKDLIL
jgi:hypothetical protein